MQAAILSSREPKKNKIDLKNDKKEKIIKNVFLKSKTDMKNGVFVNDRYGVILLVYCRGRCPHQPVYIHHTCGTM
jgi:hypothetical protein